jgi:hypothetical protein
MSPRLFRRGRRSLTSFFDEKAPIDKNRIGLLLPRGTGWSRWRGQRGARSAEGLRECPPRIMLDYESTMTTSTMRRCARHISARSLPSPRPFFCRVRGDPHIKAFFLAMPSETTRHRHPAIREIVNPISASMRSIVSITSIRAC